MRKQAFSLGLGVAPRYPPCKPRINHLKDSYAVSSRNPVPVQGQSFMAAARIQDKTTLQHKLFSNPTRTLGMPCKYRSFNFFSDLLSIYLLLPLSSLRYGAFPKKKFAFFVAHFFNPIHSSCLTKNVRKKTETSFTLTHTWEKKSRQKQMRIILLFYFLRKRVA